MQINRRNFFPRWKPKIESSMNFRKVSTPELNPDKPEPKKKLITKASRRGGKNTKKDKLNFVPTRRKRLRCAF